MKKIGFVDYYISEWHANSYPSWIAEANERMGLDYKLAYAWAEEYVSPYDGRSTDEWCEALGVERCMTISELCEKSDVIVILAPSNPEKHLGYAEEVFKYGKLTYVDKTFAPDLKTAQKIFLLAKEYGTTFFSTSALRYATELDGFVDSGRIFTTGGGSNLAEYIIHQVEMVVKLMGAGDKIRASRRDEKLYFDISYKDGRSAAMTYSPELSFGVGSRESECFNATSAFFVSLITDILRFFETGKTSFDTEQTLEAMRMRDGALLAAETIGEWIDLNSI